MPNKENWKTPFYVRLTLDEQQNKILKDCAAQMEMPVASWAKSVVLRAAKAATDVSIKIGDRVVLNDSTDHGGEGEYPEGRVVGVSGDPASPEYLAVKFENGATLQPVPPEDVAKIGDAP